MHKLFNSTWTAWQPWQQEAKTDVQYYLGDQYSAAEKAYLDQQARPYLVINKMRRFIHLLTGYQRQNRLAIGFSPFEGSDSRTAEQFSNLMLHHLEKRRGYHQTSRVFSSEIKTGLDWLNIYMDFSDDMESGDIMFKRCPWTKILPDPLFQEIDGSDMNYLFRSELLTKKQLEMLMPAVNIEKEFFPSNMAELPPIMDPGSLLSDREDRYHLSPTGTSNPRGVSMSPLPITVSSPAKPAI